MAVIISGSNSFQIAKEVSQLTNIPIINKIVRKFADNETYVRLENVNFKDKDVYIIHTLYPAPNENVVELLLTIDAVADFTDKIHVIIPYVAYARQDKKFQEGEAFSIKTLFSIFKALGVKDVTTIDAHFCRKQGDFDFFGLKLKNLTATPVLLDYVKNDTNSKNLTIVGPDAGSKDFLSSISSEKVFLEKVKVCPFCSQASQLCKCSTKEKKYNIIYKGLEKLKGKDVVILDDIISTGGTMISLVENLRPIANKIAVGCTHGLFLSNSLEKLQNLCNTIISTNTIDSTASKVSIAGLIARTIK